MLHSMVWVILVLTILHFACIGMNASTNPWGKLSNWAKWFREFTPKIPPGTLIPFIVGTAVILMKTVDLVVSTKGENVSRPRMRTDGSASDCEA